MRNNSSLVLRTTYRSIRVLTCVILFFKRKQIYAFLSYRKRKRWRICPCGHFWRKKRQGMGIVQAAELLRTASLITLQLATKSKTGVFNFVATCNVIRAGSARSVSACRVICAGSARAVAVCRVVCAGSARSVAACTVIRAGSAKSVTKCSGLSFPVPPNYPIFAHCVKRRLINKARRKIRWKEFFVRNVTGR